MDQTWIGDAPQMHIAWTGSGPVAAVIVTGLINAARVRASELSAILDGRRVGAISLPSLATLPPDDVAARIATFIDSVSAPLPLLAADDLAGGVADRAVRLLRTPPDSTVHVGQARAASWRQQAIVPPAGEFRLDGTHLSQLWHFLRDCQIDSDGEPIPEAFALHAAFLEAAENPEGFARMWHALAGLPDPDWPRAAGIAAVRCGPGGVAFPAEVSPGRRMVPLPRGALHVQTSGGAGRPLLFLHHGPGATPVLDEVIEGLGTDRPTIAPDFLGCGRSQLIDDPVTIETLASDMLALLDAMEIEQVDVFGTHTGALVALCMGNAAPQRVGRLILEGFTPPITADPDAIMAAYPNLDPVHHGGHVAEAWTMRRDMFRFAPFFAVTRDAQRRIAPANARFLHRWTMTLLHGAPTFRHVMRAAFAFDGGDALRKLTRPALVCAGPEDSLHAGLALSVPFAPANVTIRETPATLWHPGQSATAAAATLAIYRDFLAG